MFSINLTGEEVEENYEEGGDTAEGRVALSAAGGAIPAVYSVEDAKTFFNGFSDTVQNVKATLLKAFANTDRNFEDIVEDVKLKDAAVNSLS